MHQLFRCAVLAAVVTVAGAAAVPAVAQDTLVSVGSPTAPFSQNKQNEPAVAIDPANPNVVASGSNDNIDMEACNAGPDDTCPFTLGVGGSGVYFSTTGGASWIQPTYTGLSARDCLGAPDAPDGTPDADCTPTTGPIGTLPNYQELGLVSDGDPALAWGPAPDANGAFAWSNGHRLYYANLTSAYRAGSPLKGFEGIAVSHTVDVTAAAEGQNTGWSSPVIASKQNGAQFSDKEQIWADDSSSSSYFGNVYVCYAQFRGNGGNGGGSLNQPLSVIVSRDGGKTWAQQQLTAAAINPNGNNGFGRTGCTVRTASNGDVYLFDAVFALAPADTAGKGAIEMFKSTNGGRTWSKPQKIADAYDTCNYVEPSIGRCVEDGVGGARSDLSPAPSVDIANGAPNGGDATNRIVLTWVDGRDGLNHEHVLFTDSANGGQSWSTVRQVETAGDRGYYSAPAISPNGSDVWLVYNAFEAPWGSAFVPHPLVGVVKHAAVTGSGVGAFSEFHRGATGDARGSSQNDLAAEFLGDYVYASASRTAGVAVWNDVRNAADCPAVDTYRNALHDEAVATGATTAEPEEPRGASRGEKPDEEETGPEPPDVQQVCPANFGNTDIFGGTFTAP